MDIETRKQVLELLHYLHLGEKIEKADIILGLGSIDYKVAEKCAQLYHQGYGKNIVFTGNCGKGTKGIITQTEAENFRDIAIKEGVPEEKIFMETEATNTFENYLLSKQVILKNQLPNYSFIVVQKPYAERRSFAIASKYLANQKFYITSPIFEIEHFEKYYEENPDTNLLEIVNEIVAEISVIEVASKVGIQAYQEIPETIKNIAQQLRKKGYNKYIVTEEYLQEHKEKIDFYLSTI